MKLAGCARCARSTWENKRVALQPRRNSATPRESASKFEWRGVENEGREIARNETREGLLFIERVSLKLFIFKKNSVFFFECISGKILEITRIGKICCATNVYIERGEINLWKLRYGKIACIELFPCARWLREIIENRVKPCEAIREAIHNILGKK